jgi:Rps23 Pro-64 3,4-dihydroxylase Tpa1-like proline 4-hydroxylase
MKFRYFSEPISFCIIRNFYSEDEIRTIYEELNSLEPRFQDGAETGTAQTVTGDPKKSNRGIFLDDFYGENRGKSAILTLNRKVFSPEVMYELEKKSWIFKFLKRLNHDSTLLSLYKDGDYYRIHEDESFFTAIYYTWKEPKTFEGGDLYFGDFKVPIKNNSLLIFPSNTEHEVKKVRGHGRYAISQFISNIPKLVHARPFDKYPNFLSVVDFGKVKSILQEGHWDLRGKSFDNGLEFWFMDLSGNPYFSEYLNRKISETSNLKLKLMRVYANGQTFGQNGSFHQDSEDENAVTAVLYMNEIDESVLDEWGGETQFKFNDSIVSNQPLANSLIVFKSNIFHRGLAPSRFCPDMRVTIAWKFMRE